MLTRKGLGGRGMLQALLGGWAARAGALSERRLLAVVARTCCLYSVPAIPLWLAGGELVSTVQTCVYTAAFLLIWQCAKQNMADDDPRLQVARHSFVLVMFVAIVHVAAVGRFNPVFSSVSVFIPLLSLVFRSNTFAWTLVSFIFMIASTVFGHLSPHPPCHFYPLLFSPLTEKVFFIFTLLEMTSFFFLSCLVMFLFTARLNQLHWERRRYLATMSHEIRTPLHSIRFHAEQLAMRPELHEYSEIRVLTHEAKNLASVADNVLDLMKMEDEIDSETSQMVRAERWFVESSQIWFRSKISPF